MGILEHFEFKKGKFKLYSLKDEEWDSFIDKLPEEYKDCFISNCDLVNRISIFNSTKEKELLEILPTEPTIKSGDFGEILAYKFLKEINKGKKFNGPKKWRWKEDRNKAAPYSDVILFSIDEKDKSNDLILSAESKMNATNKRYNATERAVAGANKDYTSRLAQSLSWIRKRYKDESLKVGADKTKYAKFVKNLDRFIESEVHGPYLKKFNAIAFVDKEFFDNEVILAEEITLNPEIDLEVYIVGIKDLKEAYEKVYLKIPQL